MMFFMNNVIMVIMKLKKQCLFMTLDSFLADRSQRINGSCIVH